MVRRSYTPEQIINKLREAEIHINQGMSIAEASRRIGITQPTYYRWRKESNQVSLKPLYDRVVLIGCVHIKENTSVGHSHFHGKLLKGMENIS